MKTMTTKMIKSRSVKRNSKLMMKVQSAKKHKKINGKSKKNVLDNKLISKNFNKANQALKKTFSLKIRNMK